MMATCDLRVVFRQFFLFSSFEMEVAPRLFFLFNSILMPKPASPSSWWLACENLGGMTIARDGRSSWFLGGTPAVWRAHHPHQVELDLGSCLPHYEPAVGTTESLTLTEKLGERHQQGVE
jgi:hypothetical protein